MGKKEKGTSESRKIKLLKAAFQDINDIIDFIAIANNQPLNAARVGDAIFETIDRIGLYPFAFKECSEIPTKAKIYRQAVCLSWQIIYKITESEIIILAIIHQSRRPSRIRAGRKRKE